MPCSEKRFVDGCSVALLDSGPLGISIRPSLAGTSESTRECCPCRSYDICRRPWSAAGNSMTCLEQPGVRHNIWTCRSPIMTQRVPGELHESGGARLPGG